MSILNAHKPPPEHPWLKPRSNPYSPRPTVNADKMAKYSSQYFNKPRDNDLHDEVLDDRLDCEEYISVGGHSVQIDHLSLYPDD